MKNWILAARPKTLTAALVPVIAGAALCRALGFHVDAMIMLLALFSSLFIQIATNLVNDAADFEKGADTGDRLGPVRVTQAGLFSARQVKMAALTSFVLAALCGIPLVLAGGVPILAIGVFSIIAGWAYTSGPFPLAYKGWGDLFVILFFGLVAVMGFVFLQTQQWRIEAFFLGIQVGLHCAVLIAINNLRDVDTDRLVDKKTLPVRFGKQFGKLEIAALCLLPFILQLYWWQQGFWNALILPFLAVPLAYAIIQGVFKNEPGKEYNRYLARAAGLHISFGMLISVGFIL